jgi:regulatory protein
VPSRNASSPRTLRQRAIAWLARRDYARGELAQRLAAAGGSAEEIGPLLDELEQAGYLCDVRFASAVVRQRQGSFAKRAIAQALREKGVNAGAAAEALAALDGIDEIEAARALWQRRFGTPPRDEREKGRQYRFLVSRGYSASIALRVLRGIAAAKAED